MTLLLEILRKCLLEWDMEAGIPPEQSLWHRPGSIHRYTQWVVGNWNTIWNKRPWGHLWFHSSLPGHSKAHGPSRTKVGASWNEPSSLSPTPIPKPHIPPAVLYPKQFNAWCLSPYGALFYHEAFGKWFSFFFVIYLFIYLYLFETDVSQSSQPKGQVQGFEMGLNVPLTSFPLIPQYTSSHYPVFIRRSEPYVRELIRHTIQALGSGGTLLKYLNLSWLS